MRVAMKDALSNVDMVGRAKKIGNNTFEYQRKDGARVIRLHQTDVAVYDPNDDSWELNSGGWRTPTTKDRLTNYTPFRVTSDKGSGT